MATALIRVFGIEAFDAVAIPPSVSFDVYIDDISIDGVGRLSSLVPDMVRAGSQMEFAITSMMKAHIALDKVGMVASSKVISSRLQQAFGDLVGPTLRALSISASIILQVPAAAPEDGIRRLRRVSFRLHVVLEDWLGSEAPSAEERLRFFALELFQR